MMGTSVVLTSAVKRIDIATYDALKAYGEGNFQGGEIITMDAKTNENWITRNKS